MGRRRTDRIQRPAQSRDARLTAGPFTLDYRQRKLYVEGEEKSLPPKLFDLLTVFLTNANSVLSTAELASHVWDPNYGADRNDVKQYVYLLRRLIESDPHKPRWLLNVRGFGYQLKID